MLTPTFFSINRKGYLDIFLKISFKIRESMFYNFDSIAMKYSTVFLELDFKKFPNYEP